MLKPNKRKCKKCGAIISYMGSDVKEHERLVRLGRKGIIPDNPLCPACKKNKKKARGETADKVGEIQEDDEKYFDTDSEIGTKTRRKKLF